MATLALVAILAAGAIWFVAFPPKPALDLLAAEQVKVGMSQQHVRELAGSPRRESSEPGMVQWEFDSDSQAAIHDAYLEVIFDSNKTAVYVRCGGKFKSLDSM